MDTARDNDARPVRAYARNEPGCEKTSTESTMPRVVVTRSTARLMPDARRVITKPFVVGGDPDADGSSRTSRVLSRILDLPESSVVATLADTQRRYSARHLDFTGTLARNYMAVAHHVPQSRQLSEARQLLIGAYFTHEYSIDAAALSNPSIVPAPDQRDVPQDSCRFVLSLRGIGEGHVSSIQFRSGIVDARGNVSVDEPTAFATTAVHRPPLYDKAAFRLKLVELHSCTATAISVLESLPDCFTFAQLEEAITTLAATLDTEQGAEQAARTIHWLASSNYDSAFDPSSNLSERVIFPAGPTESHGMEDARFVRFEHDDKPATYFASYTAYDGYRILPQLIETPDFVSFRIATLAGNAAANKGMALFPRKVHGRYVALARVDNENNFVIFSDDVRIWQQCHRLQGPSQPWELTQIGNCGSPIETDAGWLVITHGVGPLREYALGAILLDLDDPTRIIGKLTEPLLSPAQDERDGYVPNVVYSCGSMIFRGMLVVPYGISDVGTRFAAVSVDELLSALTCN